MWRMYMAIRPRQYLVLDPTVTSRGKGHIESKKPYLIEWSLTKLRPSKTTPFN